MLCAEAIFHSPGSKQIRGSVVFTQTNEKYVRVDIDLVNVPLGIHGIHIHENPIKFLKVLPAVTFKFQFKSADKNSLSENISNVGPSAAIIPSFKIIVL